MPAYYNTSIPVSVYDFETRNHIGDYESINIACRKLYIRNATTVTSYLTRKAEHTKGVASYKDKRTYHFEIINQLKR